jgi:hypothetical protein
MSQVAEHRVKVPGASIYYAARRSGPGLFAARLRSLLRSPASRAAAGVQDGAEVTK